MIHKWEFAQIALVEVLLRYGMKATALEVARHPDRFDLAGCVDGWRRYHRTKQYPPETLFHLKPTNDGVMQ